MTDKLIMKKEDLISEVFYKNKKKFTRKEIVNVYSSMFFLMRQAKLERKSILFNNFVKFFPKK
mgnify:FL=1|jgi:nucleoid DNA-binding protein